MKFIVLNLRQQPFVTGVMRLLCDYWFTILFYFKCLFYFLWDWFTNY